MIDATKQSNLEKGQTLGKRWPAFEWKLMLDARRRCTSASYDIEITRR
jgi:hypothetical protein